uniref:Uncharacterized protein n=1 Tax=Arundo donax TaxID=35708 RepID=A0A0A9DY40_ARUDO
MHSPGQISSNMLGSLAFFLIFYFKRVHNNHFVFNRISCL